MPQQTPFQARAGINPVLTRIAQGIQQNDLIGYKLLPRVDVSERGGKILTFGRESFKQYQGLSRAPGGKTQRVQFGYAGSDYTLVDYSLEGMLPKELLQEQMDPAKGFTVDGAQMALEGAAEILALRLEIAQAALVQDANQYDASNKVTLSGTSQWSDFTGTSNPLKVVETAKEVVRAQTGKRPTIGVMGATVFAQLKQHPIILDRIKYTGRDVPTTELLASLFGLNEIVVGESVKADDNDVISDVWGKHMIIAYTDTAGIPQRGRPSFGYTYNLAGYPIAETAYYGDNEKTWYFPTSRCEAPVIAAKGAGYLIQNAVA